MKNPIKNGNRYNVKREFHAYLEHFNLMGIVTYYLLYTLMKRYILCSILLSFGPISIAQHGFILSDYSQRNQELQLTLAQNLKSFSVKLSKEENLAYPDSTIMTLVNGKRYDCKKASKTVFDGYDEQSILKDLKGRCARHANTHGVFQWCHRSVVSKLHHEAGKLVGNSTLGVFSSFHIEDSKAESRYPQIIHTFKGNDKCQETKDFPEVKVKFQCCSNMEESNELQQAGLALTNVKKYNECQYDMTICLKSLCELNKDPMTSLSIHDKIQHFYREFEATLKDQCFTWETNGWWKYKICAGKEILQYHESTDNGQKEKSSEISLGSYDEEHSMSKTSSNEPSTNLQSSYVEQIYTNGELCTALDVTLPRTSTIRYTCGEYYKVVSVEEDKSCHYLIELTTPLLCHRFDLIKQMIPTYSIEINCHELGL